MIQNQDIEEIVSDIIDNLQDKMENEEKDEKWNTIEICIYCWCEELIEWYEICKKCKKEMYWIESL